MWEMYVIHQNDQEGIGGGGKSVLVNCEGTKTTEAEREEKVPFRYITQERKMNSGVKRLTEALFGKHFVCHLNESSQNYEK